jgi:hypothetical protein
MLANLKGYVQILICRDIWFCLYCLWLVRYSISLVTFRFKNILIMQYYIYFQMGIRTALTWPTEDSIKFKVYLNRFTNSLMGPSGPNTLFRYTSKYLVVPNSYLMIISTCFWFQIFEAAFFKRGWRFKLATFVSWGVISSRLSYSLEI